MINRHMGSTGPAAEAGAEEEPEGLPPEVLPQVPPDVPLEFAAFCELHRPRYLSYARVWLTEHAAAATAVQQAFAEIAVQWRELLGSSNPTARAWQILRGTVAEHSTRRASTNPADPTDPTVLRRVDTTEQDRRPVDDDLAILHYVVGLAAPEIADVIGTDTASVAGRLRRTMLREATGW
ncbi:hypothetical protein ACIBCA_28495 [Kitasatospora sp. NPDC051170]|uniref:hypothetical protein n=1 Tax=Kitasatospora sp. NPDC051170 TaxID=3364056 RepID=UPI0037A3B021